MTESHAAAMNKLEAEMLTQIAQRPMGGSCDAVEAVGALTAASLESISSSLFSASMAAPVACLDASVAGVDDTVLVVASACRAISEAAFSGMMMRGQPDSSRAAANF